MTKKNTVGGPRARRTTVEDLERKKKYKSRAERDRMWQRRAMFATILLVGISLLVLFGAIFYEQVWRPRQPITTVNGVDVSTRDFQERVRFTRWMMASQIRDLFYMTSGNVDYLQQIAGQQIQNLRYPSLMGGQVLDQMEEEVILEQAAKKLGVTVDKATVDKQISIYMASRAGLDSPDSDTPTPTLEPTITATPLVSPTPSNTPLPTNTPTPSPTYTPVPDAATATPVPTATPGPSPTPTETPTPTLSPTPTATLEPDVIRATAAKEGDAFYKAASTTADVNRSAVWDAFYYDALRTAVQDFIGKDVPAEELQVDARHILIAFDPSQQSSQTGIPPTDEQKQAAKARADEVMAALQNGEPFADLAQAASDDTGSATQGGELGWSSPDSFVPEFKDAVLNAEIGQIIGPIETQYGYHIIQVHAREVRTLSDSDLSTRRSDAYQKWLDEQKAAAKIKRRSDWIDRIPNDPTYDSLLGDILPIS